MNQPIFIIALAGLVIILTLRMFVLELRLRNVFGGKKAGELEGVLREIMAELHSLKSSREEIERYLASIEIRLKRSAQYIGMVRFNPFPDAGGDQSFAIAIMDEKRSGVVISSLYARENSRIYAKPLENGGSRYQLSREETQAIEQALGKNS